MVSVVPTNTLCIEISTTLRSDLPCRGQRYQCWYFFTVCLALVCDEIFLLPFLRLYNGMGKDESITISWYQGRSCQKPLILRSGSEADYTASP